MELVYIAAAIMIGLGALGTGIGFALLAASCWNPPPVSRSWAPSCKPRPS